MSETQLELQTRPAIRWKRLLLLWTLAAAAITILLINNAAADTYIYRVTRWFVGDRATSPTYFFEKYKTEYANNPDAPFYYRVNPPLGGKIFKRTDSLWEVLKAFGEGWIAPIIAGTIWVYVRYKWAKPAAVFLAIALAGGLSTFIRLADGRTRPIHTDGLNDWELWRGFYNEGKDVCFPSGHATIAFAAAAVLTYLSPRGKVAFLCTATGTAISRVVMGAHFWSDVIFGAVLGWTVGLIVMTYCDRFFTKIQAGAKAEKSV